MSSSRKYDVYLSFRGVDTRRTLVSHLFHELRTRGISAFDDYRSIDVGIDVVTVADQTIKSSKLAIVVVSENYAESGWCLDELVKILEVHEKGSLTLVPIFYEVEPSDLRKQTGKIGKFFELHETRRSPETVRMWRTALTRLANMAGFVDSRNWESEAEMIRKIVNDISSKLKPPKSDAFDYPVGMKHHVEAVNELLDLESKGETRVIGIWGMAGVGKTMLARFVYENNSRSFHTHVFLENVSKIYLGSETKHHEKPGLTKMLMRRKVKEYIFREVIRCAKGDVDSFRNPEENTLLKEIQRESQLTTSGLINLSSDARLASRKVLLVVDDIKTLEQCEDVRAVVKALGRGSRIILTTRDQAMLDVCQVTHAYAVGCLSFDEALQLFCQFAFLKNYPPDKRFGQLSFRALSVSSGLPLSLKVLASFLQGKGEDEWEAALKQLEGMDENVSQVLKNIPTGADAEDVAGGSNSRTVSIS